VAWVLLSCELPVGACLLFFTPMGSAQPVRSTGLAENFTRLCPYPYLVQADCPPQGNLLMYVSTGQPHCRASKVGVHVELQVEIGAGSATGEGGSLRR